MPYSMHLLLTLATMLLSKTPAAADGSAAGPAASDLTDVIEPVLQRLRALVEDFRRQAVSPTRTHEFERQLQETLREFGRGEADMDATRLRQRNVDAGLA